MWLYICPENQRILWTTINKVKGFTEKPDSDEWFKNIISEFYHKNSNRILSSNDLLKLNKETIEYMIQQLKPITPSITSSITSSITPSITPLDPDTKMSSEEMNARLTFRHLQDQIDELREEIRALKKQT